MKTLDQILFDSKLRSENFKDAFQLGLFGKTKSEALKNVLKYNASQEPLIDHECEELKLSLGRKTR